MMDFEKINIQSVVGDPEREKPKVEIPFDYQNIRNEAITIIDKKIVLLKNGLGPKAPEIARYENAKDKLNDDQYIINLAKVNNWEKSREEAKNLNEKDKQLTRGLVMSVLRLQ